MLASYGDIRLASIKDEEVRDWTIPSEATHVRVVLPADPEKVVAMTGRGYLFGDRTVLCSISTRRLPEDLGRGVRAEVDFEPIDRKAMLDLSLRSFHGDRRFYVTPSCDQMVAARVLEEWIAGLDEALVCRVKGAYAGFLAPMEEDGCLCVNLAATDERFRLAGAAMALYTSAMRLAHDRGYAKLTGRISTRNMPVLNLYAHLGAKFSDPRDVFLKEV